MTEPRQTWSHQLPAIDYMIRNDVTCLEAVMGAGKSKMVIETLRAKGTVGKKRSLILCPKAVMGVWRGQFARHAPGEFDVLVLDGSGNSDSKADLIRKALMRRAAGGLPLVVVVNYESASIGTYKKLTKDEKAAKKQPAMDMLNGKISKPLVEAGSWEVIVADESQKIKGYDTQSSRWIWHFGRQCVNRIGMTGTLLPNTPMDVFAQYRFLRDTIFGRYITHFRKKYCVMNQYIPQKVDTWINQEEMTIKINLIRYTITKDVLVLPDKQDIVIEVPLSPAGMRIYKDMRKDAVAEIKSMRENGDEFVRTAIAGNGAVKWLRLLQLAQGYVKDDEGNEVDTDTEKRKALLELLEEATGEPVCVYAWFHHDMKCVEDCCQLLGLRYGELSGRQGRPRSCMNDHGEMADDIDVAGVQMKSGGSGINLTRASIGIFMNTGMVSPGDYDQVVARQHRPGQTRNVRYYHLVTPGTVDETVAKARQEKRDVVDAILNSEEFF